MKRVLLSAFAALSSFAAAYAQPTLTAATSNPVAGETFYSHSLDTAGVWKGATGAGVTWDFDTLTVTGMDTSTYMSCAATPYCDSFPGANIAVYTDSSYGYGVTSATSMRLIGLTTMGNFIHMTGNYDLAYYPTTYNSTHVSNYSYFIPSFGATHMQTDSMHADAWGTLKLPNATYTNVLRVHTVTIETDSFDFGGMPFVTTSRSETYNWYTPGFHNALFTVTYDTSGGMPYVNDARYYTRKTPTGVKDLDGTAGALHVYPNPAANTVNIKGDIAAAIGDIVISDVTGRVVGTVSMTGKTELSFDVTDLSNGMYIISMPTANGRVAEKFTVAK